MESGVEKLIHTYTRVSLKSSTAISKYKIKSLLKKIYLKNKLTHLYCIGFREKMFGRPGHGAPTEDVRLCVGSNY